MGQKGDNYPELSCWNKDGPNFARTMTYNGVQPVVEVVTSTYQTGVKLSQKAMAKLEKRLERLPGLEKYFVRIVPLSS